MIVGLLIGFLAGMAFTCWRYNKHTAGIILAAERVARTFALSNAPLGPDLQHLSKLCFQRRVL